MNEQGIFPEVDMANAKCTHGMNFTFVFRNSSNAISRVVLRELGFPFTRPEDQN